MAGAVPRPFHVKRHPVETRSIVAINPLAPLVALLGLDRESGDRTGFQALDPDRLAGFLAIAVGPVVDPVQCSIDFVDQLALAVAGAKLDGPVGLRRGAIGQVGVVAFSCCRISRVSRASRRMSFFQLMSLALKYDFCRSFMNGSSSDGT